MKTLALDLGTRTGWCYSPADGDMLSDRWDFKGGRYEGGGMRYVRFRAALEEFHARLGVEQVFFEEVRRHQGTDAAHVYGGLLATLTAWCEERQIPYEGVPVGTIKKFITGKGNAGKDAVIDALRARGFEVVDDNEADAIALMLLKQDEAARRSA